MKRCGLSILFVFLLVSGSLWAQDEGFGLGVILGEPTGINFKAWTGHSAAFVGAAAWSFGHEDTLHLHLDYLLHNFRLIKLENGYLPVYYGIGARIKTEKDVRFGVRFPLGINYMFENAPLDVFVEIAPVLTSLPRPTFTLTVGSGSAIIFRVISCQDYSRFQVGTGLGWVGTRRRRVKP